MKIKNIFFVTTFFLSHSFLDATQFIYNTPGEYILGGLLTFNPSVTNDNMFYINSSDIILDLGGNAISQGNVIANTSAIIVAPNLSNITIRNGTIKNFTGTGITINNGCSDIFIENIQTLSCDSAGIALVGTATSNVQSTFLTNITILNCCQGSSGHGISLEQCTGIELTNCRINGSGSVSHNMVGYNLNSCKNCHFDSATTDVNIGQNSINSFRLTSVTNSLFFNCVAHSSKSVAPAGTCFDYELVNSNTSNIFINCFSFEATATATSGSAFGYLVRQGNDANYFLNCKATHAASHGACAGFSLTSVANHFFIDCLASNNTSIAGSCAGYSINSCTGATLVRCIANDNASLASTGLGIDLVTGTGSECMFQENLITRNIGVNTANSFGIRITGSNTTHGFVNNVSMRNGTTAANQLNGFAAGQKNDQALTAINGIGQPWTNVGLT